MTIFLWRSLKCLHWTGFEVRTVRRVEWLEVDWGAGYACESV
jgi:hypothetical protein